MKTISDLSEKLRPICEFEIRRGNQIERVDRPAGSNCPLAIIFAEPLDIAGYVKQHGLPKDVDTWENLDSHYPIEAGYFCERTHHAIAGPTERKARADRTSTYELHTRH